MKQRRNSRPLMIGNVQVGGGAPVVVQTMANTDTRNIEATSKQVLTLAEAGAEIVRLAVPDMNAAKALPDIVRRSPVPLIADIHFDYRLALAAIEANIAALRLNPGNIPRREQVEEVVQKAKERQIPIRIGVNAGSLSQELLKRFGGPTPDAMVESALGHIHILEDLGFELIKVSLKSHDVLDTVEAYEKLAERVDYPLHIGITEAGTPLIGATRSGVGLGILLNEGLGDTLRVSLTGNPIEEVYAGYEILRALRLRTHGAMLVSCPTCGRCEVDLISLAQRVEAELRQIKEPITVAVMGCVVNGPGEAKEADVGIAGGHGKAVIFRRGQIVETVDEDRMFEALMDAVRQEAYQKRPR